MRKPTAKKNPLLTRYWIEFEHEVTQHGMRWLPVAVGVTAYSLDDALDIIHQYLYEHISILHEKQPLPPVVGVIEDIDISTLKSKHGRLVGAGIPIWRGIWYPNVNYWAWRFGRF